MNEADFTIWRIESGRPGPKNELIDTFTPYEVGIGHTVSETKGCYTGQEVLARQVTYDKITRQMAGLRLASPASVGSRIQHQAKNVGEITSSANSPSQGPIALAVIKRPAFEVGTELEIQSENGPIAATVVALPFSLDD